MLSHVAIALSTFSLISAVPAAKSGPSCAAPASRSIEWVGCDFDNAWYGVSKKDSYDHWSAEFRLCAGLGGHVAWMNEQDEDQCAAQALIQTNTLNEYVVLSGDKPDEQWVWPHDHPMTYYNWFPGSTSEGNCMGAYYDGTTYGWVQADCFQKSKAMCRVNC